jgi:triosephosphate isomerase
MTAHDAQAPGNSLVTCTNTKASMGRAQTLRWIQDIVQPHADALAAMNFFACLPSPLLLEAMSRLATSGVKVGAQDAWHEDGNHTGQVPVSLLAEIGCRNVMLGHAEHRAETGETEDMVARKAAAAARAGVRPLVCIGESERLDTPVAARQAAAQARQTLEAVPPGAEVLFLYEPSWAIGASEGAPPEHVARVLHVLRKSSEDYDAQVQLLYGGSVLPGTYTTLIDHGAPLDGLGLGRAVRDHGMLTEVAAELLGTTPSGG